MSDKNEEIQMLAMPQPFMHMIKNDKHNRIELHLRGEFGSPQESTQALTELYQLSEMYPTCLVFINSNGGRIDILMEIINCLKKFETVITVVTSNAASAGMMLWGIGDIRVTCPHTEFMAHRETSGYIDKSDAMFDRAAFLKRRFDNLFMELSKDVLTDEEIDAARKGEVWLLGQDLIDRGVAISWDHFHMADRMPIEHVPLISRGDKFYVEVEGTLMEANLDINDDAAYHPADIYYDMPFPVNLFAELSDSLKEAVAISEDMKDHEEEQWYTPFETENSLREFMRDLVGKGNYQLVVTPSDSIFTTIRVKIAGSWEELLAFSEYDDICPSIVKDALQDFEQLEE